MYVHKNKIVFFQDGSTWCGIQGQCNYSIHPTTHELGIRSPENLII